MDLQTYIKVLCGTNEKASIDVNPERKEYLCRLMNRDLSEKDQAFANAVISASKHNFTSNKSEQTRSNSPEYDNSRQFKIKKTSGPIKEKDIRHNDNENPA